MTQRVSLQSIGISKARPQTPHILRWEVFEGDRTYKFTCSCDDRPSLEGFRGQLAEALAQGLRFDTANGGVPSGVTRPKARSRQQTVARPCADSSVAAVETRPSRPALFDIADRVHDRWDARIGNTVRSDLDALVMLGEALIHHGAPELTPAQRKGLRRWLREVLTHPDARARLAARRETRDRAGDRPEAELTAQQRWRRARTLRDREQRRAARAEADASAVAFYQAYGLRWHELDEAAILRVIARLRRRVDAATDAAHNTVARRLITANETLDWAARRGLLPGANPIRSLEDHQRPSTTIKIRPVDLRQVVPISTCIAIVDTCRELGVDGDDIARRLVLFFALIAFAALRPSEARRLVAGDLFPAEPGHWGLLLLHGSRTAVGSRYTEDGEVDRETGLKHRDVDDTRPLPIPPFATCIGAEHLAAFGLCGDDPFFRNADGGLIRPEQIYAVWDKIKSVVFADDPVRRKGMDVYDLRHARISHLLSAGDLDDAQIAAWSGHTISTMRSTYQGVISAGGTLPWVRELELYRDEIAGHAAPTGHRGATRAAPRPDGRTDGRGDHRGCRRGRRRHRRSAAGAGATGADRRRHESSRCIATALHDDRTDAVPAAGCSRSPDQARRAFGRTPTTSADGRHAQTPWATRGVKGGS